MDIAKIRARLVEELADIGMPVLDRWPNGINAQRAVVIGSPTQGIFRDTQALDRITLEVEVCADYTDVAWAESILDEQCSRLRTGTVADVLDVLAATPPNNAPIQPAAWRKVRLLGFGERVVKKFDSGPEFLTVPFLIEITA